MLPRWFRKIKRDLQYASTYEFLRKRSFDNILEIGSGDGLQSFKRRIRAKRFIATDVVKTKFVDEVADVTNLRYINDSFDLVLCNQVLEHVFDFHKAVKELIRVTKKGGLIMVSVPFVYPIHDKPNDFWRFTEYSIKRLFNLPIVFEKKVLNYVKPFYSAYIVIFSKK